MSIIELGHFCLILAGCFAFLQSVKLVACHVPHRFIVMCSRLQFLMLTLSFLALTYSYVVSDFSVLNVVNNSHTSKPLIYKITGVWGNHEGSMLLWAWVLALFGIGMSISRFSSRLLQSNAIACQGLIGFLILTFIIFTSSPFTRLFPPADNGTDLNPLLQDIGLVLHPPLLYGGYVGFSAVFSIAVACLLSNSLGQEEGTIIRRWCRIAWISLTAGIGLGMWWAYYELGWGGFWFWDPVENASLMPWLAGTALLHSAVILEKRNMLKNWVILLSIFTFATSLLGTFIVRSGIITSVHSFASSPERGIFILAIVTFCVGGALILYALRSDKLRGQNDFDLLSREGVLILNNYLLSGMLLIILTGTLYPTFLDAITGDKISVGAPYFNETLAPLFIILVFSMPLAGFISWYSFKVKKIINPFIILSVITIGVLIALIAYKIDKAAYILILSGIWIIVGTILELAVRCKRNIRLLIPIFRNEMAKFSAHIGLGIMIIGIAGAGILKQEKTVLLKPNESITVANEKFTLKGSELSKQYNFEAETVNMIHDNSGDIYQPQRRYYTIAKQTTTEADIRLFWDKDIYITSGAIDSDNKRQINIRIHPLVGLLWGGIILAILGVFVNFFIKNKYIAK